LGGGFAFLKRTISLKPRRELYLPRSEKETTKREESVGEEKSASPGPEDRIQRGIENFRMRENAHHLRLKRV